ncbi:conserved hypothetical protein [Pediculus humanus corporis]|uniref:EGF-like domain-containing protein n=1 Tax=Pediculus humanus subsp. corporis TaxID=121224 RepID=E0VUR4_PEDHC|nr:uncharacterized protein Phum_PHUM453010 [Pediculus humanus corporis]EEB17120.1 conserved hypothetical protein [Pediculus humanus corporis]
MKWFLGIFFLLLPISTLRVVLADSDPKKTDVNNQKLPPCQACKVLVKSFQHGMEKTSRGKFEGGDADWEEKKLKTYASSEVRFVEIQENICNEIDKGKFQCQGLAEENEGLFEDWWKNQDKYGDLHEWLCIEKLKVCCPDLHYGANCTPCQGFPNNVCNNNGKCKGSGTRKGNGQCSCNVGYEGTLCDKCSDKHYVSYKDETKMLCSPCHNSCLSTCTGAGPKSCVACKEGWQMHTELGCLDVNECIAKNDACNSHQFCVNNDGSYTCLECDKACKTCNGDGPDMCDECANGYYLEDKVCIDEQKKTRENKVTMARYITYFGLCVATCIIFQKNTLVAGLIGFSVAVYISVSELMLASEKNNSKSDFNIQNIFKIS